MPHSRSSRFLHQPEEESPAAHDAHYSSRGCDRFHTRPGFFVARKATGHQGSGGPCFSKEAGNVAHLIATARQIYFLYCNSALGTQTCPPVQWFLLPAQRASRSASNAKVRLPDKVRASLRWWASGAIQKGCLFQEPTWLVVTSDASLTGWGAHLGAQVVQGQGSQVEAKFSINWLELRAVHLALRHFQDILLHQHVLVLTDNVTTKAHINREGGTQSRSLLKEMDNLFSWVENHLVSVRAEHILGASNVRADWLSQTQLDPSEWMLHPDLFRELVKKFGQPSVDLFACPDNAQLPKFSLTFSEPGGNGLQRSVLPMACYTLSPQSEIGVREGRDVTGCASLAEMPMVR
ncbi:uncharacterized protein LOC132711049 [Pantherophis guttatus]|uniref:Uncharacterized protein LOC117656176 n=1 Tax=Pantherophis guttatus TaxID=94885 RepID=A0A6P9ARQ0_PANGU|nr:uncharacterized protein LOC117656176 [Pantherophis guttatus]XP_060545028.1 uncharacterized protein LOC132711049 [Pantherophis guttatus]